MDSSTSKNMAATDKLVYEDAKEKFEDGVELAENEGRSKSSSISLQHNSPEGSEPSYEVIHFDQNDPDDPYNWSNLKKCTILFVVIVTVLNSTMGSGLAANISPYIAEEWNITNESLFILPTSMYLVGYIIGPLVWGPLSEQVGRRWVMVGAFSLYIIFTMATALAPNFTALVIFRLVCGLGAASAITVCGGTCADLFKTSRARGRAFASFMAVTTYGPNTGPIISGYLSPISWRWSFWVGLILAGLTFFPLLFTPETYGPVILKRRAQKLRKETNNEKIRAPLELEGSNLKHIATVVLTRPVRMFLFEPIVFAVCIYLSFAYAIFYMLYEAYPIIYEGTYGFSGGEEGLTFLAIGIGATLAGGVFLVWDNVVRKAEAANKPWIRKEEYRRLPLGCIGGPFFVISCFWLGWSAKESIPWIVPVLSGIFFGIGFLLLFMSLINYLVDSYKMFAASAMAASGTCRSIWGAVLPFATKSMYDSLGVAWACSLLGFLCLALALIPYAFLWKGESLRARSKFCQYLAQKEAEEQEQSRQRLAKKKEAAEV